MKPLPLERVFQSAIDVLEEQRARYFVYGGIALPAWGPVVTTRDVDLVLAVSESELHRLLDAFRTAGFTVGEDAETLLFLDKWTVVSLADCDVDLALGATPFDESALDRAVTVRLFDRDVPIATAEDLILYKLAAYRRKDLGHVEAILARQGDELDRVYLRHWASEIATATGRFEVPGTLETMLAEQGLE